MIPLIVFPVREVIQAKTESRDMTTPDSRHSTGFCRRGMENRALIRSMPAIIFMHTLNFSVMHICTLFA